MSQPRSNAVPRLDLAPKLKRPLSLWNPLDYLRLLYWVFFFPQALRWYIDTFGGGSIPENEMNWLKGLEQLRQKPVQWQLLLQGLCLTVLVPVIVGVAVQTLGFSVAWSGVAVGVVFGVVFGVVCGVVFGVAGGVALGVAVGVVFGVALGVAVGVWYGVAGGVVFGVAYDGAIGVTVGVTVGVVFGVVFGVAVGVGRGVVFGVAGGVVFGVAGGVVFGVAGGVVFGVALVRLESWLLSLPVNILRRSSQNIWIPSVTPLPLPQVSTQLKVWLKQDWEMGLQNANQILAYSVQFIPVIQAVNQVLSKTPPEQVIFRAAQLANSPYDWDLVRFATASLTDQLQSRAIDGFFLFPPAIKRRLKARLSLEPRLDTPARAAAAGFWYLHEKMPEVSARAFATIYTLPYGGELLVLAYTLSLFDQAKDSTAIAQIQLPGIPAEPFLRPHTWAAIARLRRVVVDMQMVQRSLSRSTRAFARNRALGEIKTVLDHAPTLPEAERGLIINIAQTWREALLSIASEVGNVVITKPVTNPYVIGDPVEGQLFVGREDVMRRLEELWVLGHQLQTVVLYGHRRMGKTSILRNLSDTLGAGIKVAYVNLLLSATAPSISDVWIAICDEVAGVTNVPSPPDSDFLSLPDRTFERFLKQVEASLGPNEGLIIAIDEFEKIEDLIEAGRIAPDVMAFLRGLVQMSSKLAFAFAGLHTLEEMNENYFHPFFGSYIPIRVDFLSSGAVQQLLLNPTEDFLLDYAPEACDEIWSLTAGQPYLTQLVGFKLVRYYNDQVFEQLQKRDPVFTVEDVRTVVGDAGFFSQGHYYFTGVWGQADRDAPGQQAVLKALAPHQSGLSLEALQQTTELDTASLQQALDILKRHDVVATSDDRWFICVELFRRWVLKQQ